MTNIWLNVAGLAGATAVGLGALGAHAMNKQPDVYKEVWKTASLYHFVHALALGIVSVAPFTPRKRLITGALFSAGIILFCGSCYTVSVMNQRKPYSIPAPFGGLCFIGGWVAFGFL